MRIVRNGAPLARALSVAACVGLAAGGCDVGNKPEPPYKDPPPNQRIKSRVLLVHAGGGCQQISHGCGCAADLSGGVAAPSLTVRA